MPSQPMCPNEALLLRFAEAADTAPQTTAHIQGCPRCRRRLNRLRGEGATLRALAGAAAWADVDPGPQDDDRPPERAETSAPEVIGRFTVRGRIASGGQADVWLATHPTLGCEVAIKLARYAVEDLDGFPEVEQEARALARLEHPVLPRVYDADLHEGRPYLVMQLVEGRPLNEVVGRSTPSSLDILEWMIPLTEALEAAHALRFLHLDLKPENVLLGPQGRIKLVDFGAAGLLADHRQARSGGVVFGTPEYMAPEQHGGDPGELSPRTDVYGLGGLLYFLLFGEPPHAAGRNLPTYRRRDTASTGTNVEPMRTADSIRRHLVVLCRQMLSPLPDGRPNEASHVKLELQSLRRAALSARFSRRCAACLLIPGIFLLAANLAGFWSHSPAGASAAKLLLTPTLVAAQASVPIERATPLQTGDRLRLEVTSPDLATTEVFMVVGSDVIISCGPLTSSNESPTTATFPAHPGGLSINRLGRFPLLIAVRRAPGEPSALERVRQVIHRAPPRLPAKCDLVHLHSGDRSANRAGRLKSQLAHWQDPDATARLLALQACLDEALLEYSAYVMRFDSQLPESKVLTNS